MTRRTAVVAAAVLAFAVLGGCQGGGSPARAGGSSSTTAAVAAGAPLSPDQANRLAGALFNDFDLGGADLLVTAPIAPTITATMRGAIDWKNIVGHVSLQLAGTGAGVTRGAPPTTGSTLDLWWTSAAVIEQRPGLPEAMVANGLPALHHVRRPPRPTTSPADRLLGIITGLAAPQRDNPLLLIQERKGAFLRTDHAAGVAVEVFSYGATKRLWVGVDDGLLYRFELDVKDYAGPVVIDVRAHGPHDIPLPPSNDIVDVREIPEIYAALIRRG